MKILEVDAGPARVVKIEEMMLLERGITDLVGLKLTKKEIRDYDERYWAFAEEVKE